MIELTRVMKSGDWALFNEDDVRLISELGLLENQDNVRGWEYALALEAVRQWRTRQKWRDRNGKPHWTAGPQRGFDIGGAGSKLVDALKAGQNIFSEVVDPKVNHSLEEIVKRRWVAPIITCISVIEHVDDLYDFVWRLDAVTEQGGLIFLTMDYHDEADRGSDKWHFHWMRRRIIGPQGFQALLEEFSRMGLRLLGDMSLDWEGPQVYDYGFASIGLVKGW